MTLDHLDEVHAIEKRSFSTPWSRKSIREEITRENAYYFTALDNESGAVAGYAGMWHIVNEGHINNVAVDEPYRKRGVGSLLMDALFETGRRLEMMGITLEVRVGNRAAMALYHKYGFKAEGFRKNYYADTKEDAVIMWFYY
jgi:ribosomal-protein-alanine N-acetyltransferase